jgi:hypothetical protein
LTVPDFEVAISLELNPRQMHFLKGQKKKKIHPKNRGPKKGPKPPKTAKNTVNQGPREQRRKIPARGKCRKPSREHLGPLLENPAPKTTKIHLKIEAKNGT